MVYAKLVEILFNTANLTDVGCIFRLVKRPVWEGLRAVPMDGGWAFNLDWMLHMIRARIRFIEVPVNFQARVGQSVGAGHSKRHAARIALRMLGFLLRHRLGLVPAPGGAVGEDP